MTVEDDFLSEINDYENRIAEANKLKEEERKLKEDALRKQEDAIRLLLSLGVAKTEIAQKLGLPLEVITALEKPE